MILLVLLPVSAVGLVSEGRPGVPYFNHVLFLDTKVVENGEVSWISLGYGDPAGDALVCNNTIDVFRGRELFSEIPEKSWVLVDYELQSILVQEGFFGDADVVRVVACGDVEACCDLRDRLNADDRERARRARAPRPGETRPAGLGDIAERLEVGRNLVRVARCRGCHSIEGFGAGHAPSLSWKRFKYEQGWLERFLKQPYRMRPAMTELMMLDYTSANAQPALTEPEVEAVAEFLNRVAWTKSPADRFRNEPFASYDCYDCHTRLYREEPLEFVPTPVPQPIRERLDASGAWQLCFACHSFGDHRQLSAAPGGSPNALAIDLLLAIEKLEANYFVNFVRDPGYLQPGAKMPRLGFSDSQLEEIRALVLEVKQAIAKGGLRPVHNHYRMEKRSGPGGPGLNFPSPAAPPP
ncbi:c-type cytochrome [Desulfuromonas versatilis]|uniref:C-type cytochrome n=1 Tax=Desulfuromonas versatilis TaxID=2802975 RepID=A0ABM8HTD1_9BACT|nr:c-type cytochrome [Desulfuromonas versatilis]